jgi:glucose/arabinose dehydrogenase
MSAATSYQKRTMVIVVLISSLAVVIPILYLIHNSSTVLAEPSIIKDSNLKVETVVTGLSSPTSMVFIDSNNILVLEKGGQVRLVSNVALVAKPVLQVPVATESERGLLGITSYSIRNSFGITFDPLNGNLWQTENGPDVYDEINIVKPGFNSGWIQLMGPLSRNPGVTTSQLVNYPGSYYANPIFSWKDPVAVTAIEFMKSSVLGQKYKNNIFVGDYNNGNLYYFEVNNTRTGIKLDPTEQQVFGLSDIVVDNSNQLSTITFGNGFGGIADIKTGPADSFLYILSINDGNIYKIVPFTSKRRGIEASSI